MKAFLSIFVILALSSRTRAVEDTTELFIQARQYQDKLAEMQSAILEQFHTVNRVVTDVLSDSTNTTLTKVEANVGSLLTMDNEVRDSLEAASPSECVSDLLMVLNGVTRTSGVDSAVCLSRHNNRLQGRLAEANAFLRNFGLMSGEVQQAVVWSFIGVNAFKEPQTIIDRFERIFNENNEVLLSRNQEVEDFVADLMDAFSGFHGLFDECTTGIQAEYAISYRRVESRIESCTEFANTGASGNFRRGSSARMSFELDDFLPNRAQWLEE